MTAGQKTRSLRSSLCIGAAIAAGTIATFGTAAVGLEMFKRATRVDHEWAIDGTLTSSEYFQGCAVGYGGEAPGMAPKFLRLLADEDAEDQLVEMAVQGASAGRLYGLCGLRILGSKRLGLDPSLVARWDD